MFSLSLWCKSNRHYILDMGFKNMNPSHIDLKTFPDSLIFLFLFAWVFCNICWYLLFCVCWLAKSQMLINYIPPICRADDLTTPSLPRVYSAYPPATEESICSLFQSSADFFWNCIQVVISSNLLITLFLGIFPLLKGYKIIFIWSSFSGIKHIEGTERTCMFQMMK